MLTGSLNGSLRPCGKRRLYVVTTRICECVQEMLRVFQIKALEPMPTWGHLGTGTVPVENANGTSRFHGMHDFLFLGST